MRRSGPTRHHFVRADPPDVDPVTQVEWCFQCNLPRKNAIHDVPQQTDEQRAVTARMVGERGDQAD